MHVRWELYPVPHEAQKAHYGGSYLEESEWWKKPREVSLLGEDGCARLHQVFVAFLVVRLDQVILGLEIVVGVTQRYAGVLGDGAHRRSVVTVLPESAQRAVDDTFLGPFALARTPGVQ